MKITVVFIFCFLILNISLNAQDEGIFWNNEDDRDVIITPDKDVVWVYEISEKPEKVEIIKEIKKEKGPFRIPNRKFEIGLLNLSLGVSNDFMTTFEFFKEKVILDLDKLSDGFNVNANLSLNPVFINFNKNNIWGFGLSTGLDLLGIIGLNGNMLTFHEANAAESDLGAAVFANVNIHGFFTYEKFKIKIKPAVYYPIIYAKPNTFSYTFKNIKDEHGIDKTYLNMQLDMRIYTASSLEDDPEIDDIIKNISAKPGADISIGAEYPLSEALGLTEKIRFLDFDVGIDFINIPLQKAEMEDYMQMIVNIGSDEPIDFFDNMFSEDSEEIDLEKYYNYNIEEYGKEKIKVHRPFKVFVSANWRPFDSPFSKDSEEPYKIKRQWLTVTPILGFAINPLYFQPVSFEGGIKTRLSFANFINVTLDTGYYDRLWKYVLDFALNIRLFEIDLGVSMQSPGFLKSWSGGGYGAFFGLKFGW